MLFLSAIARFNQWLYEATLFTTLEVLTRTSYGLAIALESSRTTEGESPCRMRD